MSITNLPACVETEKAVLGYAMLDPESRDTTCGTLEPDHFTLEVHRKIWRVIKSLYDQGRPIDRITVYQELDGAGEAKAVGGLSYLVQLDDNLPQLPEIDGYVERLQRARLQRRVLLSLEHFSLQVQNDPDSIDEVLNAVGELPSTLRQEIGSRVGPIAMHEMIQQEGLEFLLAPRQHGSVQLPWPRVDEALGGLSGGQMIVIMAATSRGKTSLALQIAICAALRNFPPVMWTMEMSRKAMFQKAVTQLSGVWAGKRAMSYTERDAINQAAIQIDESYIYLDADARSVPAFVAGLRKVKARGKLGLAVVDYLQLIRGSRARNRAQEVSDNSRALKLAAMDLEIPIVVLSQVDRGSVKGDGEIGLHSAKESGDIENDADVMLWVKSGVEFARDYDTPCELHIGKQREGPKGFSIPMVFRPSSQSFMEVAE